MDLLLAFLFGAFFANGIPHFIKGITGETHMTPIGVDSHPVINVVWGLINFVIAGLLWTTVEAWNPGGTCLISAAGVVITSVYLAWFWSDESRVPPWLSAPGTGES